MNKFVSEKDTWFSDANADAYDSFCAVHPMYSVLSWALLDRFPLPRTPNRVCDLGCGTGESTRVLQKKFPKTPRIVGIDQSSAMLGIAKLKSQSTRVTYLLSSNTGLGKFDLIVANASIWQWDPNELALFIQNHWDGRGTLLYNLPSELVKDMRHLVESCEFNRMIGNVKCRFDMAQWTYTGSQAEAIDFLKIPIFRNNADPKEFLNFSEFSAEWTLVRVQRI